MPKDITKSLEMKACLSDRDHWLDNYIFLDVYFKTQGTDEYIFYTTEEINLKECNEYLESIGLTNKDIKSLTRSSVP